MDKALRCLLVLGKVAALEEAVRCGRRVHKKVRWPVQFDYDATQLVWVAIIVLEVDRLDAGEWVLDLVASLFIVDVIRHGALVGRVENDQIHGILAHTRPLADTKRAASQVMDHCNLLGENGTDVKRSEGSRLTNFALAILFPGKRHAAMAIGHEATAKETSPEALARLHGLHSQISPHGLGYRIEIFAGL